MTQWLLLFFLSFTALNTHAEPLPAAEVFQAQVQTIDPNTFVIDWTIKPHYFLYSDRIKLNAQENSNVHLGTLRFPTPEKKTTKQGKILTVYRNKLALPVGILGNQSGEALLELSYQGCSDDGFCYPPETKQIKITINNQLALSQINFESTLPKPKSLTTGATKDVANLVTTHHWSTVLLLFFGMGLLLSFTPCILPMIPVLSGIIVGHGATITTRKAFFLSLSYVLSMSITYALFGAVIALVGANLQINMQSPWAIVLFSMVFVLLALSMFGFYEFRLPQAWQSKIAGSAKAHREGHYLGAAIMGCLSTLILSPCVTAPLIGVLTYIAQTKDIFLGSLTLFFLGLGMGTPLLLIGTSAGKWLPEAGAWMNAVKAFFGILLLAIAIYLLARIIPEGITMVLWASLLIFSGIYAGALTHSITHKEKFNQGVGVLLLVYGLLILVGASMGSTNPIKPLAHIKTAERSFFSKQISKSQTLDGLNRQIANAKGRPVMLDFYADWCASCKVLESTTLNDARVQEELSRFKVIKVDLTHHSDADQEIMEHFNVIAPPTFVFFNAQGREEKDLTLVGEISTDQLLQVLSRV